MKRPTYSDIAKKLSKKKAKFEALGDSFDPAKKFTAERMVPKYESKLDELFQVQEISKSPEGKSYLKNGGKLKYQDGGFGLSYGGARRMAGNRIPNINRFQKDPVEGNLMDYVNSLGSFGFGNPGAYSDLGINPVQSGTLKERQTPVMKSGLFDQTVPSLSRANMITSNRRSSAPVRPTGSTRTRENIMDSPNRPGIPSPDVSSMGRPTKSNPLAFLDDLGNMGLPVKEVADVATGQKGSGPGMDILGAAGPFMDNLANLINPTPKIPSPRFMTPARMETRFNVAPQINEMRRGMRNFNQSIDRSVGQAGQGAAFKGKALADYFKQTGNILGQKENVEQGLRNQQAQEIAKTDNMNQQIASQFDQQQLARQESERLRRMGMLANLGEDFMTMSTDRKLREKDEKTRKVLEAAFDPEFMKNDRLGLLLQSMDLFGSPSKRSKKYGGRLRRKMKK